ncbi:hypothetical protein AL036_14690 [Salipiger aestuarii]|uniref:Uncharacterized protein (PEP-CTERM system associated) n=1 Tax=Salipiger aestuarii TaxID=568098 RepID=A0A327XSE9_9RHOB|nr:hypothetical protein [Salipiger aestuarii]KAA8606401.1 hypothetical protein AL036_14690 [Salipiger aestuarii]KAB2540717.1 hypothetical protein AL035_16105 [Salipiger aestuarii]RAK11683.1 uncharacterized protein (PEP-CTERM system associated) [Salipiger aestuarii]
MKRPFPRRTATALAALSLACALPLAAQEAGGVLMQFTLSQRLQTLTNPDLVPGEEDESSFSSNTNLGFSLSSVTRTDKLTLTLGGSLRHVDAPNADDDVAFGFQSPSAGLSYARIVGTNRLSAGINLAVSDISYLRSVTVADTDSTDPDGGIPDDTVIDIDDEYSTGTRRELGANAEIGFGVGGPVELGLSLNARSIRYSDAGPSYDDSDGYGLRGSWALALPPGVMLSGGLGYSQFKEDGSSTRDTWSLSNTLALQQARGTLSGTLGLSRIEEGTRSTIDVGWSQALPDGALGVNLGVTRAASGDAGLTGGLSWSQDLPNGRVKAALRHGFGANSDDQETRFTNASASLSHQLTPLTAMTLGVSYVRNEVSDSDSTTRQGALNAGVSHDLGQDWGLGAGYRHTVRREDGPDWAASDSLYLSLGRTFSVRY